MEAASKYIFTGSPFPKAGSLNSQLAVSPYNGYRQEPHE
jgi:hypothetical protein